MATNLKVGIYKFIYCFWFIFLPFLMKFFFLVRFCAIRDSFFTVNGMKWSNALCLVFFLLTLKRWYAFFDWIFGSMLIIRWIWSKWGVRKFNSLKIQVEVQRPVYCYSLVRSISRGRKLDWLIYLLVWPKI